MVDSIESFSEVYEDDAYRLTGVDCTVPMVHHVHQCVGRWPFLQRTILSIIQRLTYTLKDPWHPPCSIYVPDSLFPQSLSNFSLVYLLAWHPPLHTPYISLPNHCRLFAALTKQLGHFQRQSSQPITLQGIQETKPNTNTTKADNKNNHSHSSNVDNCFHCQEIQNWCCY